MITHIPTIARGAVRAYVKALPGFDAYLASKDMYNREVKNHHLIEYAEIAGKTAEVEAIIDRAVKRVAPVVDAHVEQVLVDHAIATNGNAFELDAVLSNVEAFLSPIVRKSLENALIPVLEAANKPAVVQTVEKIVTRDAPILAPTGQVPYATKTGATMPFNKLFSVRASQAFGQRPISLWEAHGMAPPLDPFYVVPVNEMAALATAAEHGTNVWLVGPSGSGKSTMPHQFAAFTGRPYTKIAFTKQTDAGEMVGGTGADKGSTQWEDGALVAAIRRPGNVIVIEEPTTAPAGVQMIIQNMTDDFRTYTIHSTGEVVKVAPGVVFVITDNTNGSGDETGQYAGTNPANQSLVNRFKRMVQVDYLSKAQETSAIVQHTQIPAAAAAHVADFMARARKLPEMEGVALSIRLMVGFIGMVKDGFDAKYAFECAVLTRLPGTERAVMETMATLQWSQEFELLLAGAPVTNTPSNTPAASAFDDEVSASFA